LSNSEKPDFPAQAAVECLAWHELHRHEIDTIVFIDVIDRDDVRMVQRGGRLRLLNKAPFPVRIGDSLFRQYLDGQWPVKADVHGPVHHAHSALAQFSFDPVMAQGLADHMEALRWNINLSYD
jgi:hypothetical protein